MIIWRKDITSHENKLTISVDPFKMVFSKKMEDRWPRNVNVKNSDVKKWWMDKLIKEKMDKSMVNGKW